MNDLTFRDALDNLVTDYQRVCQLVVDVHRDMTYVNSGTDHYRKLKQRMAELEKDIFDLKNMWAIVSNRIDKNERS